MRLLLAVLIALIYLFPWFQTPAWGTTYTINGLEDFGGTYNGAYDTILFDLPGDVITCDSGIFTSSGANSVIDFDDDTVYYHGTQNTNNGSRIALLVQGDFTIVKNIKIQAYQSSTDSGGIGLNIGGSTGIVVDSTTGVPSFIHAAGKDANSVYCDGAAKLMLRGFNATHFGTKFTDRSYQRGYAIWLNDYSVGTYDLDSSYGYWVEDIVIDSAPHGGVAIVGNGDRLVMKHIVGRLDCRNDEYDTLTSDADTKGVANSFFLAVDNYGENAWVSACSLLSTGTVYQGARGIALNDDGPAGYNDGGSKSLIMEYCYFKGSSGYDDYFKWNYVGHMLQSEEPNNGLIIRNCYFEGSVAPTPSVASYKGNRHSVVYFGHSCDDSTQFYNNRVICNGADGLYYGSALGLDQSGAGYINSYNNYYEAPVPVIRFGAVPDGGRDASGDCAFATDTIYRSAAYSDSATGDGDIAWISTDNASLNNRFTDIAYTDSDTTISMQATGVNKEATFHRTLPLVVLGVDGYPVSGARVRLWNAYSDAVGVDTTGADGTVDNIIPAIRYDHYGLADSTYSDFAASAIINSDSTTLTGITIGLVSGQDTLTMSATAGFYSVDDFIVVDTNISYSLGSEILTIARHKGVVRNDSLWIFTAADNGQNTGHWSADSGATWTGVDFLIDAGSAVDYHMAVISAGGTDGIHIVAPDAGFANLAYRYINPPCTDNTDEATLRAPVTFPGGERAGVASKADSVWVVARDTGDLDTLAILKTTDQFATDTTYYSRNVGGASNNHRVHLTVDDNGLPSLFWYKYNTGFYWWEWQGDGFYGTATDSVVTTLVTADNDRCFAVAYTDAWNLVYGHDGTSTTDSLLHLEHNGSSWDATLVSTATSNNGIGFYPQLGSRNDSLFLFYQAATGVGVLKVYDGTSWWADSIVITGAHTLDQFVETLPVTPTTFNFVPYWFMDTSDSLWFGQIDLTAPAPEAAATRYVMRGWKR